MQAETLHSLITLAPAQVIAIAGVVSVLTQALKRIFPKLGGFPAMVVNLALSLSAIFATMDPTQFWTEHTAFLVMGVFSSAAGIHSTARSFRNAETVPSLKISVLALALCIGMGTLSGCALKTAKAPAPLPIGAVDLVDANANETLQAAHAFALYLSTDVQTGKLALSATQRRALNSLNAALNTADAAEIAYHRAGGGSASQLDSSLAAATTALVQVQSVLAPPVPASK